jgi:hypothetical protein
MTTRFDQIKNNMQNQSRAQKEKARRDYKEFFEHPLLYVALIASGLLSALAGLSVGLGVKMENGNMQAHLDIGHIFFASLYFLLFPYFFEYGLYNWSHKFLHREPNNNIQFWTASVMSVVTFIGTAITAYSAMDVLVTAGGFFDTFTEIPPNVQGWIAFAIPTMILLNIVSGEVYRQFTTSAILMRSANISLKEDQMAADLEIKLAKVAVEKDIAIAQAEEYSKRATAEAPELGRRKGAEHWNNDRVSHHPVQSQPAMVLSQETRICSYCGNTETATQNQLGVAGWLWKYTDKGTICLCPNCNQPGENQRLYYASELRPQSR